MRRVFTVNTDGTYQMMINWEGDFSYADVSIL